MLSVFKTLVLQFEEGADYFNECIIVLPTKFVGVVQASPRYTSNCPSDVSETDVYLTMLLRTAYDWVG